MADIGSKLVFFVLQKKDNGRSSRQKEKAYIVCNCDSENLDFELEKHHKLEHYMMNQDSVNKVEKSWNHFKKVKMLS